MFFFKKIRKEHLAIYLFFCFTLFFFPPIETFITNKSDLWFGINDILWGIMLFFLLTMILLLIIDIVFLNKTDNFILLLFGIAISFYIQGNFLKNDFGVIDGQSFDLNSNWILGVTQTAIWIILISFPFILSKYSKNKLKLLMYLSLIICGMQASTLVVLGITSNLGRNKGVVAIADDDMFEMSGKKNILVIMADAFESDFLNKILNDTPDLSKELEGFTFYEDALATSLYTQENMALLLTGNLLETEYSFTENIDNIYAHSSIYTTLEENNFESQLYVPSEMLSPYLCNYTKNIVETQFKVKSYMTLLRKLYKISWFKYIPYWIKPLCWMESNEFSELAIQQQNDGIRYPENDIWLNEQLTVNGLSKNDSSANTFKFFYMLGPHPPYLMNSNGDPAIFNDDMPEEERQLEQAKGTIYILRKFILQLKENDVFDNTAILFIADHGWNTRTNPVMLVKPFNSHGEFRISTAPISFVEDYMNTLEYFITENPSVDNTIFEVPEKDIRERSIVLYDISESNNDRYYNKLDVYKTTGNAKEMNLFCLQKKAEPYCLGERVEVTRAGKGTSYFTSGIAAASDEWTWSLGTFGRMEVVFQNTVTQDLLLEIETANYLGESQICIIKNNQKVLGECVINTIGQKISISIPKEFIVDNTLELWFEYPNSVSPKALGLNDDTRPLAIGIKAFTISTNN